MPESDFHEFEQKLLKSGVAPRHVRRSVLELREHLQDLEDDATARGMSASEAASNAKSEIGDLQHIATLIALRPELRSWPYRYPALARLVFPVAYAVLLPVTPLFMGVARAPEIARWIFCMTLGALVTGGMFLLLQLSIVFNG